MVLPKLLASCNQSENRYNELFQIKSRLDRLRESPFMKRFLSLSIVSLILAGTAFSVANGYETKNTGEAAPLVVAPAPHCEVPCGIYSDQMRFEMMLEDTKTIAKAITSLKEYCDGFQTGPPNAKVINQMTRWVNTKEQHATNTQHIMSQYFLTQRIKPDNKEYAKQLAAAHKVMVCAMKCKQDPADETAVALKASILDFYRAYEGKEPSLHEEK